MFRVIARQILMMPAIFFFCLYFEIYSVKNIYSVWIGFPYSEDQRFQIGKQLLFIETGNTYTSWIVLLKHGWLEKPMLLV